MWEFSGNPVYYCSYDYFAANDNTAIHLVLFSLEEPYETQLSHVTYWLNLLKALTLPQDSIGEGGNTAFVTGIGPVFTYRAPILSDSSLKCQISVLAFMMLFSNKRFSGVCRFSAFDRSVLIRCVFLSFSSFRRSYPATFGGRPSSNPCRPRRHSQGLFWRVHLRQGESAS